MTVDVLMKLNDKKNKAFQFLKSMEIALINSEIENLHPSTHGFWKQDNIHKEFMEYLGKFAKNKLHIRRKTKSFKMIKREHF